MKNGKLIRFESYESMLEREEKRKRIHREKQIIELLKKPELSEKDKDKLLEELYSNIEIT